MLELKDGERLLVIFETGNGYSCGCCRRTNLEYETYDSAEELVRVLERSTNDDSQVKVVCKITDMMEFGSFMSSKKDNNHAEVADHLKAL
jgi:hypothetical protein